MLHYQAAQELALQTQGRMQYATVVASGTIIFSFAGNMIGVERR
jgi:hypothetical protein